MKSFHIQAENLTFFLACVDYAKKAKQGERHKKHLHKIKLFIENTSSQIWEEGIF